MYKVIDGSGEVRTVTNDMTKGIDMLYLPDWTLEKNGKVVAYMDDDGTIYICE